ncbi:YbhB/YbcL family Raf kinase inhibitor-like protein [Pseudomonas sp. 5P_5.1_Bac1]|uniref:YbhB/YbcL family Raf kinase inhibitor-like protein n=1 Tax=Pseudomonas sp. 5P_5.1_Bac1 TaxID=2971616 RepID=UPI003965C33F
MKTLIPALALLAFAGAAHAAPLSITSTSFTDGGRIALAQVGPDTACGKGQERSPQLSWSNLPEGTRSVALVMFDPDGAKGLGVVHWVAYNIDAKRGELAEGVSEGITVGKNVKGATVYRGPCPPAGDNPHHYALTLIATDLAPGALPDGLDRDGLLKALQGHALGAQSLVGLYGH